MPSTLLLFQLTVRTILEVSIDLRKKSIAYQFNYSLIKKYFRARVETTALARKEKSMRREGTFAFDLWQNLKIGDVIIMKQGQEFPADVLIIDSEFLQHSEKKKNVVAGLGETSNAFIQTQKENILVHYGSNR